MFSHVMVGSNDIERSKSFYDSLFEKPAHQDDKGRLAYRNKGAVFMVTKPIDGQPAHHANGGTIGFNFDSPEEVDAWHKRGVEAGGTADRGRAGLSRERVRQALPCLSARSGRQQALRASPAGAVTVEIVCEAKSHGGRQLVVPPCVGGDPTDMTFSIFLPPQAGGGGRLPVVWYLSGLTCTHANVTEKGEYRAACAELGLIFVAPDTSPRGEGVPDDPAGAYDLGLGAGFYVDATQAPWSTSITGCGPMSPTSFRRWSQRNFPVDLDRQGITGHSMGGHGALTIALRHPDRFRSRVGLRADRRAEPGAVGREGAWPLSRRGSRGVAQA